MSRVVLPRTDHAVQSIQHSGFPRYGKMKLMQSVVYKGKGVTGYDDINTRRSTLCFVSCRWLPRGCQDGAVSRLLSQQGRQLRMECSGNGGSRYQVTPESPDRVASRAVPLSRTSTCLVQHSKRLSVKSLGGPGQCSS